MQCEIQHGVRKKRLIKARIHRPYPLKFRQSKKLYPSENCSREKYSALKMSDEGGDCCGPCRRYPQPMLMRKSDQYVHSDMYDSARKEIAMTRVLSPGRLREWSSYAPIMSPKGDRRVDAITISLQRIRQLAAPHTTAATRHRCGYHRVRKNL